jgi:1-acyl-sn-glycerol-3-phosphate acyltransferase
VAGTVIPDLEQGARVTSTTPGAASPVTTRDALVAAILAFIGNVELLSASSVRAVLEREIDAAGPAALAALNARLAADDGWAYYPRDPLAQRLHHLLADCFLERGSTVTGLENLEAIQTAPLTLFANHLSYADANVVEVLLQRAGAAALANRLTAIAGPKVFTSRERRFSSLCFGTIKVPQSADVSSGEAQLNVREVARAARQAIDAASSRLAAGDVLLLFGEGTRSRSATMQPMLAGVARYLDVPGTFVVPVGLTGPESLFPVDAATVHPSRICIAIGRPLAAASLMTCARGNRRLAMDAVGIAIAELLPPSYRGVYANAEACQGARRVLQCSKGEPCAS